MSDGTPGRPSDLMPSSSNWFERLAEPSAMPEQPRPAVRFCPHRNTFSAAPCDDCARQSAVTVARITASGVTLPEMLPPTGPTARQVGEWDALAEAMRDA